MKKFMLAAFGLIMGIGIAGAGGLTPSLITAPAESMLEMRALADCHGCVPICNKNLGSRPSCGGSSCGDASDWFCSGPGQNNAPCGAQQTIALGPLDNCVAGSGFDGACTGAGPVIQCYEQYQCACSTWASNECDCGPYSTFQTTQVNEGC